MPSTNPLVSVIIPNYNSDRTLRLCLDALDRQTYTPFETIVVDDASTDGSHRIAEAWGATVLHTGVNSGQQVARNVGAAHARGEILFFTDADTTLDPGSIAAAVEILQADPGLGGVSGALDPEPLLSTSFAAKYRSLQMQHFWFKQETPTAGPHMAMFAIPAAVFAEVGSFDPRLRHTDPQEFGGRLRQRYRTRVSPRIHGRHDHQHTLREVLPKVFKRALASMRDYHRGGEIGGTPARAIASGLVLGAGLSLPLPLWLGAAGAVVPAALVTTSFVLDAGTYRGGFAAGGLRFGVYFVGAHLVFQTTAAAGAVTGLALRMLPRLAARPSGPVGVTGTRR